MMVLGNEDNMKNEQTMKVETEDYEQIIDSARGSKKNHKIKQEYSRFRNTNKKMASTDSAMRIPVAVYKKQDSDIEDESQCISQLKIDILSQPDQLNIFQKADLAPQSVKKQLFAGMAAGAKPEQQPSKKRRRRQPGTSERHLESVIDNLEVQKTESKVNTQTHTPNNL